MRTAASTSRRWLTLLTILAAAFAAAAVIAPSARAGEWAEVACMNPSGSSAPYQNWSQYDYMNQDDSASDQECSNTSAMVAQISTAVPNSVGAYTSVLYTPPAGSLAVGGTVDVDLTPIGNDSTATAVAGVWENGVSNDQAVLFCAIQDQCAGSSDQWDATFTLPDLFVAPSSGTTNGDLLVGAECGGGSGTCATSTSSTYSEAQLKFADMLLQNDATPAGSGFTGTALGNDVSGTGSLLFTATDSGGPGVYNVTVSIDGTPVYSGMPNTNGGECASVGDYPGSSYMMFDYSQPCPTSAAVDVPVATTSFANGTHELTATVTDAAGNTATVLDQDITVDNPSTTPTAPTAPSTPTTPTATPLKKIHDKAVFGWVYRKLATRLTSVRLGKKAHLPAGARVSVACEPAKLCPRTLPTKSVGVKQLAKLFGALKGRRFKVGAVFQLTISAPHRKAERFVWTVRSRKLPAGRVRYGVKRLPKHPVTTVGQPKPTASKSRKTKKAAGQARRR